MADESNIFRVQVGPALADPVMETMNFLNEAAARFPNAISFAAGRPPNQFVDTRIAARLIERFVTHRAAETGRSPETIYHALGQYGDTNGMIRDLIAQWLAREENIRTDPRAIMVTNGFQEALVTLLLGIFQRDRDVILAEDPCYVGLAGASAIANIPVAPVPVDRPLIDAVAHSIAEERSKGRNPRAFYVVPDYSNPSGRLLSLEERVDLLALARREGILLLEDVAYRSFTYEGNVVPSLKSLDDRGHVVWLGSFAKIFMPGVRLGFLVADQVVAEESNGNATLLAEALSKVKSFVSVLSAPLAQAVVGGLLIEQDFSLLTYNRAKIESCAVRRGRLLECLDKIFGQDPELRNVVHWNRPSGGFFLGMTLPFEFGRDELVACARNHGVIVCPMSFFSLSGQFRNQIRLAFSNVALEAIEPGIRKLHTFVRETWSSRKESGL